MAASPGTDRDAFLGCLRASELVGAEQLEAIARRYADVPRAPSLARRLVRDGTLTRFQAERLLAGRTAGFILGQYRILEQIGRGGMGRVYKAEHATMRRVVALKVLAPELLKTERAVGLFLREVRAAAQLVHPNVVTAFDANEVGGRYYLVLEYVDGPNLDQLVRRQGPLPVGLACEYVRQAACGLQSAHALGMVHRDVKPANMLLQRQGLGGEAATGLVKISDFGLARLGVSAGGDLDTADTIVTKSNTVMGTPDYLSPEQSRSLRTADIRSDLYSLGCSFYFLLTGHVPYPGGSVLEKLVRHATTEPEPIRPLRPDLPEPIEAIVYRLLDKAPEARYQTPAELAEALRPFAVSGAIPWAPSRAVPVIDAEGPVTPTDDLLAPRDDEGGGPLDALTAPESEAPSLVNTLAHDDAPTPALLTESPSRLLHRPDPGAKRRLRVALLSALAVVGTLVAVIAALAWR